MEEIAAKTNQLDLVVHGAVNDLVGPLLDLEPDYVGLVQFLAGPEASMIQGQVIFVNGGHYVIA